jgi:hypothetical protein
MSGKFFITPHQFIVDNKRLTAGSASLAAEERAIKYKMIL